jgi:DsbC/DsbD-like thiol-disulfide interchange protein
MSNIVPFIRRAVLIVVAAISAAPIVARAQDASPWIIDGHASVRLLAGSRNGAVMLGGIDLKLDHGWKTYWRTPGDSGVPPRLDFSKSENVEAVTVLWPAPKAFPDGAGGTALGYHDEIVIPLRIAARDPDKPMTLRAHISYAVCEKLCVPQESELTLPFVSVASTEDSALSAALNKVPKPATIGDPLPLTIRDIKRVGSKSVQVDVAYQDGDDKDLKDVNLFVEGPSPEWALPIPKPAPHQPKGIRRFVFDLDGVPPGVNPSGAALKYTLADTDRAFEFNANLD